MLSPGTDKARADMLILKITSIDSGLRAMLELPNPGLELGILES